jgi:hypothetical protein
MQVLNFSLIWQCNTLTPLQQARTCHQPKQGNKLNFKQYCQIEQPCKGKKKGEKRVSRIYTIALGLQEQSHFEL